MDHIIGNIEFNQWGTFTPLKSYISKNIDIETDEDNLILSLEIPGYNRDDVKVKIKGTVLKISWNKKDKPKFSNSYDYRIPYMYGIPEYCTVKDGILKIILPKNKDKEINIKVK